VVDPQELEAELERVRSEGYAVSLQQFNMAQSGIAAPVFDAAGRVDFALCTLAFSTELGPDDVPRVGPAVRDAARRATLRCGGRWIIDGAGAG
jgi:DNA-binding IclR family transcriptional regulator